MSDDALVDRIAGAPVRFRFDGYLLDIQSEVLTDPVGCQLHLRPKTLQVLIYLVQHRAKLVSKQELLQQIWHDTVVEDQAVFQSVSEIRATMQRADCIRTAKSRGYQWILETHEDTGESNHQSMQRSTFSLTPKLSIAMGCILCVLAIYWFSHIDFRKTAIADEANRASAAELREVTVSVDDVLRQAQVHMARNQFEEARSFIDLVLSIYPSHLHARLDLAYLFKLSGDLNQAERTATEVYDIASFQGNSQAHMSAALLLSELSLANRRENQALSLGEEALSYAMELDNEAMVAASLEQLAAIALTDNDREVAKEKLNAALIMYGSSCPTSAERVRNKLVDLSSGNI